MHCIPYHAQPLAATRGNEFEYLFKLGGARGNETAEGELNDSSPQEKDVVELQIQGDPGKRHAGIYIDSAGSFGADQIGIFNEAGESLEPRRTPVAHLLLKVVLKGIVSLGDGTGADGDTGDIGVIEGAKLGEILRFASGPVAVVKLLLRCGQGYGMEWGSGLAWRNHAAEMIADGACLEYVDIIGLAVLGETGRLGGLDTNDIREFNKALNGYRFDRAGDGEGLCDGCHDGGSPLDDLSSREGDQSGVGMIEGFQGGKILRFESAAQAIIEHHSRCFLHVFLPLPPCVFLLSALL